MKKKRLKKGIAELRSENQALRKRIEKLEKLSQVTAVECSTPKLSDEEKYRGIARHCKECNGLNPKNLDGAFQGLDM